MRQSLKPGVLNSFQRVRNAIHLIGIALFPSRNGDLDVPRSDEFGNDNSGSSWSRLFKVSCVNCIHSLKGSDVGQVNLHAYDVVVGHARRLQDCANVFESLLYFGLKSFRDLAGGILTALARDIKGSIYENSWAVIAARLGACRQDDLLVHREQRSCAKDEEGERDKNWFWHGII